MKRWNFSILLLALYVSIFEMWHVLIQHHGVLNAQLGTLVPAAPWVLGCMLLLGYAVHKRYFVNRADLIAHCSVIAHVIPEAFAPVMYEQVYIALYALAFGSVIFGYRALAMWWDEPKVPRCTTQRLAIPSRHPVPSTVCP